MFAALPVEVLIAGLAVGAVAGILAGLLGIGGGLIIVPSLVAVLGAAHFPADGVMHVAVSTSLATIVFTSISSAAAHHRRGAVLWREAGWITPGIVAGAALGATVAAHLGNEALRIVFGAFECLVAVQLLRGLAPRPRDAVPHAWMLAGAGAVIGGLSTILGIGGGVLTVPFLMWAGIDMRRAVATSSVCGVPIAIAGTGAMIVAGLGVENLPPGATGYVYWPAAIPIALTSVLLAPLGAHLAHTLPVALLRRLFAGLLLVIGVRMLV
jgi:uncharacterized membrane protein YfcA